MMLITVYMKSGKKYRLMCHPEFVQTTLARLGELPSVQTACQPEVLLDPGFFLASRIAAESSSEA